MSGEVAVEAHPEMMRYLKIEAGAWLFTAFLCVALVLLVLLFTVRPLTWGDGAWMTAAVLIAGLCGYGARWALTLRPPRLVLAADVLTVGATRVPLDATTHLEVEDKGPLPGPARSSKALFRLPGMSMYPHFDGGPRIRLRTGEASASFQPLLYGPALFLGGAADPRAAELIEGLVARSRQGDVSSWLRATFAPPGGAPKVDTRVTVFLVTYIIVSAAILGFLGWLLALVLGRGPHGI
jgi:hypothetical protein